MLTVQPLQTDVDGFTPMGMASWVYRTHSRYTVSETDIRVLANQRLGGIEAESTFAVHVHQGWHIMAGARYRLLLIDSNYTGARIGVHYRARRDTPR